ncbi:MAG: MazG family protein, partial [Bdellovibrionota bacterium]
NEKLIRRHPHVFGDVKGADADSAYQSWEKQKAKEKVSKPNASILDGVPKGLPALQRAARFIEKVTKVGFQWNDLNGPMDKLDEEMAELKTEIHTLETMRGGVATAEGAEADQVRRRIENELGDLLFSICNVAFLTKTLPEDALRGTLARFESRFKHIERRLKEIGKNSEDSNLEEMDQFWNEAKKLEKS